MEQALTDFILGVIIGALLMTTIATDHKCGQWNTRTWGYEWKTP